MTCFMWNVYKYHIWAIHEHIIFVFLNVFQSQTMKCVFLQCHHLFQRHTSCYKTPITEINTCLEYLRGNTKHIGYRVEEDPVCLTMFFNWSQLQTEVM